MNPEFQIYRADISSLEELREISIRTFTETFAAFNTADNMRLYIDTKLSHAHLEKELLHPESEFYLVKSKQHVVAYLKLNFGQAQTETFPENTLEIERIYVLQELQGTGLGRALFELALNIAKSQNKNFLWLAVWEKNEKAIRFYGKLGFEEFGEHAFLLGEDVQRDVLMRVLL